jgi:hypothetical protein
MTSIAKAKKQKDESSSLQTCLLVTAGQPDQHCLRASLHSN